MAFTIRLEPFPFILPILRNADFQNPLFIVLGEQC